MGKYSYIDGIAIDTSVKYFKMKQQNILFTIPKSH